MRTPPAGENPPVLRLRPFTADRLDALLDFCARHPASPFPPAMRRRLMTRLVSGPSGVIELVDDEQTLAVAVAVDAIRSVADCAVLDLLGGAAPADPILDAAESAVHRGPRTGLEVPLTAHTAHWRPALEARGYRLAYTSYEMSTPEGPPPPMPPLPGPDWRWVDATRDRAAEYHRVVGRAMGPVPGTYRVELPEFVRHVGDGAPDDLLLCGERIAGFVRIGGPRDGVGQVNTIGRDPAFRGQRLGPILLARAMRRLADRGAQRFALDVTASNAAALDLYRGHGFAIDEAVPVLRRVFADG